jgi:hypothetical protein
MVAAAAVVCAAHVLASGAGVVLFLQIGKGRAGPHTL